MLDSWWVLGMYSIYGMCSNVSGHQMDNYTHSQALSVGRKPGNKTN